MLTTILRPRWTLKYLLGAPLVLYVLYCLLFNMPFFSSKLPAYSGEHAVGTIDLEVACEKRNLSDAVFKDSGKPAFELESVLFSLYYPAVAETRTSKPHHPWIPNIYQQAEGYARLIKLNNLVTNSVFSAAIWTLVGSTTVPAKVDVPMHGTVKTYRDYEAEHPLDDYGLPEFPVIVLSHGTASGRTSYTQFCGELASRGFVVAAIEHRDGSGPASTIMRADGSTKDVQWIHADGLEPQPEMEDFKAIQLAFRQAEVEETVRVLRLINDGLGEELYKLNPRKEGADLAEWRGRLMLDRMVIAGHSYGATLALQTLKDAPSAERPFVGGIVLDPGKQSGPLNDDIKVPIVVMQSQAWSSKHTIFHGRPHFEVVKDLVNKVMRKEHRKAPKYAWFVTCKGTTHPSITDAPLIEPLIFAWATGSTTDAHEAVLQYVKVSKEFMEYLDDGHRRGVLAEEVTHPTYDEDVRNDDRKARMNDNIAKYWQIHVSPSTACPYPGVCGVEPE